MLVYMVYDKSTGKIVHIHRAVDVAGRSCICSQDDVLLALPGRVDPKKVAVASTELEQMPSGRHTIFSVNVKTGAVISTSVKSPAEPDLQAAKRSAKSRK